MKFMFFAGLGFLLIPMVEMELVWGESFAGSIRKGNKYYQAGKYQEALESYEKAGQQKPNDLRANFNKGTALYKLQEWEKASSEFQNSTVSDNRELQAKSLYNLGNSQLQNGQYADAVRSYQESLKLNPSDTDAAFNLQLAVQFLKNPPPQKKQSQSSEKQKDKANSQKKEEEKAAARKKENEENAKRMLKNFADDQRDRPVFKLGSNKNKKEYEEDW